MKNVDNTPLTREEVAKNKLPTQQNKNYSAVVTRAEFETELAQCYLASLSNFASLVVIPDYERGFFDGYNRALLDLEHFLIFRTKAGD